jgi:hypothetical protein
MSCPNRPHKYWLIFKGHKPHEWGIEHVGVFMHGISEHFTVDYRCLYCGITKRNHFVEADKLMKHGYTAQQLKEIRGY